MCKPSSMQTPNMPGTPNGSLHDTSRVLTAWTTELIPSSGRQCTGESRKEHGVHTAHNPQNQIPTTSGGKGGRRGVQNEPSRAGRIGCRGSTFCSRPQGDGGGLCRILLLHEEPLGRGGRVRQRWGSRCAKNRVYNEVLTALNLGSQRIS